MGRTFQGDDYHKCVATMHDKCRGVEGNSGRLSRSVKSFISKCKKTVSNIHSARLRKEEIKFNIYHAVLRLGVLINSEGARAKFILHRFNGMLPGHQSLRVEMLHRTTSDVPVQDLSTF